MPVLKDSKYEAFAQAIHQGKSQVEAHEFAGFKPHRGNASKLAQKDIIVARVLELNKKREAKLEVAHEKAVERAAVSIESLIKEADEIQKAALEANNHSAAVSALTAKAKLAGLWIEKAQNENTNANYAIGDQPATDDEWAAEHVTTH